MKIFAIREYKKDTNTIGYLFYYEKSKEFYIELLDDLSEWDIPLLLSSLYKKGERTINSYWSKTWIRQRIVPVDRQNIGQILRDNNLKRYDEFGLLMLANGRCAQDDYCLSAVSENDLPRTITQRFDYRVDNVMAIDNESLLVSFRNNTVKVFSLKDYSETNKKFEYLIKNDYTDGVKVSVGGYGVFWDNNFVVPNSVLYRQGKEKVFGAGLLNKYLINNVLTTADVMKELNCSRQYVNELVKKEKLHPFKSSDKTTLFLKSEVLKSSWE